MSNYSYSVAEGEPHPLGSTVYREGVNFSVFSENATGIELLLFKNHNDTTPFQIIQLDPLKNRTFAFWHVFVKGLKAGTFYNYRADGPYLPERGYRFNRNKVLIDPYVKGITDSLWDREKACADVDNLAASLRGVIIDLDGYDWEGDTPINIKMQDTIIYEMHVGGFTKSPTAKVGHPGTFKGVIEKIPYLKELGINAVELMPVFEYDDKDILRVTDDGKVLKNYWGYNTVAFFAPDAAYCSRAEVGEHLNEFRDLVKELHKAGIQVILDVVFNHTNEGNQQGPTFSFKGFDNSTYYYLDPESPENYLDYTGCGNTFNCNHPIGEKFITDCLKYWVQKMHVDGFRFDEASVLSRGEDGKPLRYPPVLWNVELAESLANAKLIAEAWDAAGLYQIGGFPGYRWAEWNGVYRDDIRRFVRGDAGMIGRVASRIAGSSDLYQHARHSPMNSINFICCHDGFTLMDLVSYNTKHNEANGEDNRDGNNENFSYNYGAEGETANPDILRLRKRQIKNLIAILFLSQGVPMILAGDELGRTQRGNNNPYCQGNEVSWIDWTLAEKNKGLLWFVKKMIAFRKRHSVLRRDSFFSGAVNDQGYPDISWHGCTQAAPNWEDPSQQVLAFRISPADIRESDIYIMMNMDCVDHNFELPQLGKPGRWRRFADTALPEPEDIGTDVPVMEGSYLVANRSIVILVGK